MTDLENLREGELVERLKPVPALRDNDRITISFTANYEHRGDNPHTVASNAHQLVPVCEDSPYSRRLKTKADWTPLDLGWFDETQVGLLVIENLAGKATLTVPSEEERTALPIIFLRFNNSVEDKWNILPGWPFPCMTDTAHNLVIWAQQPTPYRITIFPDSVGDS